MTIYEYLNISKEQHTFKRDYIQNPLQKIIKRKQGGLEYEQPDLEDVKYLYITLNKTNKEMNKIFGYKISDKLSKWFNKREYMRTPKLSKEELYDVLYVQNVPMIDLAKRFNYKGTIPIQDWCHQYGIELKSPRYLKNKFSKKLLYSLYISKGLTSKEICLKYHTEKSSLHKLLLDYDLLTKDCRKERLKNIRIKRNPNYEIVYNKERLKEYILNNDYVSQTKLAEDLDINPSIIHNIITEYHLTNMFKSSRSTFEQELHELYPFMEVNNKTALNPYEIDLYDANKKIGIEFNGDYWHSDKLKPIKYHQKKSLLAEEKGIFIYHIFEYEWNTNREKIINQLNNLLGLNTTRIYARKCIIKEVNNNDKKNFLDQNHLQGNDISSVKIGLYHEGELVSLMTFVKPRFNTHYEWELSRFASKADCNVIGGASKLFKYFIRNYKPKSIISYSNMAHTKGNLYKMLGFNLLTISSPNYVWIKKNDIRTRYQCQKHKLIEQGYSGETENSIMKSNGFNKVYDCGNKVWVMII